MQFTRTVAQRGVEGLNELYRGSDIFSFPNTIVLTFFILHIYLVQGKYNKTLLTPLGSVSLNITIYIFIFLSNTCLL